MDQNTLDRLIESIEVHYFKASMREVIKPVQLWNTKEPKNVLLKSNSGYFFAGQEDRLIKNNDFYFIPKEVPFYFKHGKSDNYTVYKNSTFSSPEEREKFITTFNSSNKIKKGQSVFSIVGFHSLLHNAVPFFTMLDLPAMHIPYDEELSYLLKNLIIEEEQNKVGKNALIKCLLKELFIHLCRYIYTKPEYRSNLEKISFLLDKRLIKIVQYIQENIEKDLSNEKIAEVIFVSKDYVGQFFKQVTNSNLQDYIENRRLEHAHFLLRTTNDNVQEISHKVGFKDPAYFSRRFKMRFNENATEIRKTTQFIV